MKWWKKTEAQVGESQFIARNATNWCQVAFFSKPTVRSFCRILYLGGFVGKTTIMSFTIRLHSFWNHFVPSVRLGKSPLANDSKTGLRLWFMCSDENSSEGRLGFAWPKIKCLGLRASGLSGSSPTKVSARVFKKLVIRAKAVTKISSVGIWPWRTCVSALFAERTKSPNTPPKSCGRV